MHTKTISILVILILPLFVRFKAGKPTGEPRGDTVSSTLKEFSLEDKVTALKHDAKIWNEDVFIPTIKPPPIKHPDFNRTNTEVKICFDIFIMCYESTRSESFSFISLKCFPFNFKRKRELIKMKTGIFCPIFSEAVLLVDFLNDW